MSPVRVSTTTLTPATQMDVVTTPLSGHLRDWSRPRAGLPRAFPFGGAQAGLAITLQSQLDQSLQSVCLSVSGSCCAFGGSRATALSHEDLAGGSAYPSHEGRPSAPLWPFSIPTKDSLNTGLSVATDPCNRSPTADLASFCGPAATPAKDRPGRASARAARRVPIHLRR